MRYRHDTRTSNGGFWIAYPRLEGPLCAMPRGTKMPQYMCTRRGSGRSGAKFSGNVLFTDPIIAWMPSPSVEFGSAQRRLAAFRGSAGAGGESTSQRHLEAGMTLGQANLQCFPYLSVKRRKPRWCEAAPHSKAGLTLRGEREMRSLMRTRETAALSVKIDDSHGERFSSMPLMARGPRRTVQ